MCQNKKIIWGNKNIRYRKIIKIEKIQNKNKDEKKGQKREIEKISKKKTKDKIIKQKKK